MGILQSTSLSNWNYFLAIERDLEVLSRYVEFTSNNYNTYSLEIVRILFAACSEIDVILKAICNNESPSTRCKNIIEYKEVVKSKLPNMIEFEVTLPRWGMNIIPWEEWEFQDVPSWWTAYNKVKHYRNEEFHRANLFYTLKSVAALYVSVLYLYHSEAKEGTLLPSPSLFRPSNANFAGSTFNDYEFGLRYNL